MYTDYLATIFPALVIAAGLSDLLTMKIPNWLTGAIGAAFVLFAVSAGFDGQQWLNHAAGFAAAFVAGFILFAARCMGGGDAKLISGIGLWFGWSANLVNFAVLTAVLGLVVTLAIVAARLIPVLPFALGQHAWIARLHDRQTGIPYGIAIAPAALTIYWNGGWF